MAGGSSKANPPKARKRVEVESGNAHTLLRAKDGSAFARCEECKKDVPVALISMHSCSLDAKIRLNLEAQVVEKPTEATKKPIERKKPETDEPKPKRLRKLSDKKNNGGSDKPKRPPTAFFIFMDDFRKTYKEENPGSRAPKEVAKQGGQKWKSMTDEEKKPYLDKAAELKAEYDMALKNVNAELEEDENSEKETDEKEVDEKEIDGKEIDEKEIDEKEVDEKEIDEKEVNEKEEKEEEEVLDDY